MSDLQSVFITGATGFLGSHLCEHFVRGGVKVYAGVRKKKDDSTNPVKPSKFFIQGIDKQCELVPLALESFDDVKTTLREIKPQVVIHLAAIADVNLSRSFPLETFNASTLSTVHLLEAIRQLEQDVVFLNHTTDKVYFGNSIPFEETQPFHLGQIYEIAKISQDMLGSFYGKQFQLSVVNVRCGNYFGAYDFDFNRIIPYTIRQLLRGQPVQLRSNGKFKRDFLYIKDAVQVNLTLIDRLLETGVMLAGESFNFSIENNLDVLGVVEKIVESFGGPRPAVDIQDQASGEIPDMLLNCAKSRNALDWKPNYTFEQGIKETIEEYRRIRETQPSLLE